MIDPRTLILVLGIGNAALALLLLAFDRSSGLTRSGRTWALAKLLEGFGFLCFAFRGQIPEHVAIGSADTALIAGFAFEFAAIAAYLKLDINRRAILASAAAMLIVFWVAFIAGIPETARIALFTAMMTILLGGTGIAFVLRWNRSTLLGHILGVSYVAIALVFLARAGYAVVDGDAALIPRSVPQALTTGAMVVFMLVNGFGFLVLAQEDANRQLIKSRERLLHARRMTRMASVEMDLTTGLPVWSSGIPELLGFPAGQGPADWTAYRALVHPDDRAKVDDSVMLSQAGKTLEPDEYRILGGDGKWRWLRREAELLPAANGEANTILITVQDITQRVKMETELWQGYASLKRAQRMGKIGSVDIDLNTMNVRWSDELYTIYGRNPKDGPADLETFFTYLHPDDRHMIPAIRAQYLNGTSGGSHQFRIIRPDGSVRWIHREAEQTRDSTGRPVGLLTVEQDITERMLMEIELRRGRDRLVLAQRIGRIGSAEIDLKTGHTSRSDEYHRLIGLDPAKAPYTAEEIVATFHPDDRDKIRKGMKAATTGEDIAPIDLRIVHPNGSITWIRRDQEFIRASDGDAHLAIVTIQDVTERVLMETELRRGTERLILAQRTGRIGSAEINLRTGTAVRSDEFYRVLGLDPAVGRASDHDFFIDAMHPEDREKLRDVVRRTAEAGIAPPLDLRVIHPDGKMVWIRRHHDFILGPSGERESAIVTIQDVTEQKVLEQAKDEFVSTVSHELRTPLTSIRGALGLAAASIGNEVSEKVRHLLDVATRNSERLAHLVDDLLDVQRIAAGRMIYHMADVSVAPLLEDAVEANRPFGSRHGVEIKLNTGATGVHIHGDAERLVQVMNNLLSNAIKYSKPGQAVEVSLERRTPWVRITVEDHGEGIPAAFHAKMFRPFSQSDSSDTRRKGGSGLGLSIVDAIIKHHEGQISFETEMGTGTRFYIDLKETGDGEAAAREPLRAVGGA